MDTISGWTHMYIEENLEKKSSDTTNTDHIVDTPDGKIVRNRSEGHVIECDGMHAVVSAIIKKDDTASEDYWSVGMLMSIAVGDVRTIGVLYKVEADEHSWTTEDDNRVNIYMELVGEIKVNDNGKPSFNGGISIYPYLGAVAHRIRRADLAAVFENTDESAVTIGSLSQNSEVPALLAVDSMLSRHFAVVGTTGVGKSSTVTLLMRKVLEMRSDVRILILDPHNEFSSAFPDKAVVITDANLDLPFWAFKLEEIVEVLFRGRKHVPEEVDILRDLIPQAKSLFKGDDNKGSIRRSTSDETGITADTPVPYRISDLVRLIDNAMGKLGIAEQRSNLKSLLARIQAVTSDPNYRFMFANTTIEDNLGTVLSTIFRVPAQGRPITAFQLSGIPSEVVNVVVSVLCRLAFDLAVWSDSQIKTLVLCEEAHRYIPSNQDDGFAPTRQAIARIAKEGRKYGVSLGIVTQRPGELDETILSQCNTFVAMRLGNDLDQEIMRKAISGASRSFINFLPSLANREAIMFGQGVTTPMRMRFMTIPKHELPANHLMEEVGGKDSNAEDSVDLNSILNNIRYPSLNSSRTDEVAAPLSENLVGEQVPSSTPQQPSAPETPSARGDLFERNTSLRRAVDGPADGIVREGRRQSDPVRQVTTPPPSESPSGNSLVSRFRKT